MPRNRESIEDEISIVLHKLSSLRRELALVTAEKSKSSSCSYKKRKDALNIAGPLWEALLKEGDVVKVTGSRALSYRKVLRIENGQLIGMSLSMNRRTGELKEHIGEVITCGTNKITHLVGANNVLLSYKDL